VLFFSLDIGGGHFERRLLSYVARLDASKIGHPSRLEGDEWKRFMAATETVRGIPMIIEDSPASTVWILEDLCREASAKQPFDLVVVDSLQLLREGGEPLRQTASARAEQAAKMGRRMKALAAEFSVPILLLVEIDRRVELRASKRPVLDDLESVGDVAEIADTVVLLYRDEVYTPDTPDPGVAEVIFAKQLRGRTGTVRLRFDGPKLAFR
jgi:replicative DNA helicase